MAKTRQDLHMELLTFCPNVYYQPPESIKLTYPCIVYSEETPYVEPADNIKYKVNRRWQIMVITKDPENTLGWTIFNSLSHCTIGRIFNSNNLHHVSLSLYF